MRQGLQVHYHLTPEAPLSPWIGGGFGYEWVNLYQTAQGMTAHAAFDGWQFFNAQIGADYAAAPGFGLGPFVALSFGQYANASVSVGSNSVSGDIKNQALHEWLTFGVRATFDLVP
jgi:outer membrane protein W